MKYSRLSATIVILAAQVLAITGTPFSSNVYDKFRGNTYSNKGLLSESDELKLASQYHQQLLQQNRFVTDRRIVDYVNKVGRAVAARSQRPDLDYHFYVIDSDQINAFTVGGGRVYVYTGIIRRLNSEGQLAAVLGHEIGHNVGRHVLKSLKGSQKWNVLLIGGYVLGGQGGAGLASLFSSGVILKHSRDSEREADFLGLYEMRDAGYDVEQMDETWKMLESAERSEPSSFDKIFASHPPARERFANTETEIQQHLRTSAGHGKIDTPEFDQIKALLGGGRVNSQSGGRRRPDPYDDDQTYNNGRKRDRETEDSTTARRQDESRPPVVLPDDESNSLPFIDEARRALKKKGYQSARVIGTARGNVFGDGREGLLVVFLYNNRYQAMVSTTDEDFQLTTTSDSAILPINHFDAIELTEVAKTRKPAIVIHADGRSMRWVWNGESFDYFNIR